MQVSQGELSVEAQQGEAGAPEQAAVQRFGVGELCRKGRFVDHRHAAGVEIADDGVKELVRRGDVVEQAATLGGEAMELDVDRFDGGDGSLLGVDEAGAFVIVGVARSTGKPEPFDEVHRGPPGEGGRW